MTGTIDELMTQRPKVEFAVELSAARIEEFRMQGLTRWLVSSLRTS